LAAKVVLLPGVKTEPRIQPPTNTWIEAPSPVIEKDVFGGEPNLDGNASNVGCRTYKMPIYEDAQLIIFDHLDHLHEKGLTICLSNLVKDNHVAATRHAAAEA
jgi:hypothetical protein